MKSSRGFTLIELMITVMVAAILASLAVTSYKRYIERARRAEAQSRMLEIAMQLERAFTLAGAYPTALPVTTKTAVPPTATGTSVMYEIAYVAAGGGYALTGVPKNAQSTDGCGTFGLSDANVKTATGPYTVEECWRQ